MFYSIFEDEDNDMEVDDVSDNDDCGSDDNNDDDGVYGQINTEQAKASVKGRLLSLIQVNIP